MKNVKHAMKNVKWSCNCILCFILHIFHFSFAFPTLGQDAVTLPLRGYYHPGRYMPVHVFAAAQSDREAVRLMSRGSVWTFVKLEGGRVDTIVPWLPIDDRARALYWSIVP